MVYSENKDDMNRWFPVIMQGRKRIKLAATRMDIPVLMLNFGALTRGMFNWLMNKPVLAHAPMSMR